MSDDNKVELSKEARFQERDLKLAMAYVKHNDFESDFVPSLGDFFEKHHYLTDKQYAALSNLIEKWNMEKWAADEGLDFEVE